MLILTTTAEKDLIIRGGENIVRMASVVPLQASLNSRQDCTFIENALYAEPGILEALGQVAARVLRDLRDHLRQAEAR